MRYDFDIISQYIVAGSHVLDLGCGDGSLLAGLCAEKNIQGTGLENDPLKIGECIERNIAVVEHDLNQGLDHFDNDSYDVVIMTLTLQAMKNPHLLLEDMLRIGKKCIVTFPNFGYWKARWHLVIRGRMPVSDLLPYTWYDTPNIHFCTVRDFETLCAERSIAVLDRDFITSSAVGRIFGRWHPNLFGETAVYHLTKSL